MKRTFVAIRFVPGPAMMDLYDTCRELFEGEKISWVQPGNMHITLKFLGDTPTEKIPGIRTALAGVLEHQDPFRLEYKGIGVFKSISNPRVLWIGIRPQPVLLNLKAIIDKRLAGKGFLPDEKYFRPHLTLGRVKNLVRKNILQDILDKYRDHPLQVCTVNEIFYYESRLRPEGPVYLPLATYPLTHRREREG